MASPPVRILYVDDDPALARLVERALGRRGYHVVHAGDASRALAAVEGEALDAVVLDHYLGAETGLDVLAALNQLADTPPVVYVTGSAEAAIAVAALKAGAADYVHKTVGDEFMVLLASAIDQSIEKARLMREKERAERDIREARDRAEMLLAEVNHRVANSLALVAALVRMQQSAVADPSAKDALSETQARISAIAGIHRRLYTSDDVRMVEMDAYLSKLLAELETAMRDTGHSSRIVPELAPVRMPTDKAVSIGMIVTELVTNAVKYAYPGDPEGEIRVRLEKTADAEALLVVEDDGIGWTGEAAAQETGLGTRIVTAMAKTLGSSMSYGDGTQGTRITLRLEL